MRRHESAPRFLSPGARPLVACQSDGTAFLLTPCTEVIPWISEKKLCAMLWKEAPKFVGVWAFYRETLMPLAFGDALAGTEDLIRQLALAVAPLGLSPAARLGWTEERNFVIKALQSLT